MYKNLNPHLVGIPAGDAADLIELAGRHGFGGIDCLTSFFTDDLDPAALREQIAAAGLRWGLLCWCPVDIAADAADYEAGLTRLRTMAPVAQALGCTRTYDHIWPGHDTRAFDENFAFHVRRLRPVAEILGAHGIRFGIEFIGPKTLRDQFALPFIHTLDGALALADAVDPDGTLGVGIQLDVFHWYTSGATLDDIRRKLRGRVVGVHANDARAGRTRAQQLDGERALPGDTGVIDLVGVGEALRDIGFDGPVSAEPFSPRREELAALSADAAAAAVSQALDIIMMPDLW
jgi:sugar phosphate isomerase/epimerase